MTFRLSLWVFAVLAALHPNPTAGELAVACGMRVVRMRTNNLLNPLGVALDGKTAFSWALQSTNSTLRNQIQTSYRVQVSSQGPAHTPDLWDTGMVQSSETVQILYKGRTLLQSQLAYWRVTVWNGNGIACEVSDAGTFETALEAGEAGWEDAQWIARFSPRPLDTKSCSLYADTDANSAPRFRAKMKTPPSVVSARAYVAGLGYYQLFINGKKVGTSMLDPGWTSYDRTVLYAVHDVTDYLTAAGGVDHAVGVELGNGWWNPLTLKMWGGVDVRKALTKMQGRGNGTTTEPMFRLKIVLTLSDGTQQTALTSSQGSFTADGSPTRFNNIYLGEKYDATLDAKYAGWSTVGYNNSDWTPAVLAGDTAALNLGDLVPQSTPPIRKLCSRTGSCDQMGNSSCSAQQKCPWSEVIPGVLNTSLISSTHSNASGGNSTFVLDAGKNHAGVCRFRLNGGQANKGRKVYMRYGELLGADGSSLNAMTSVAGQIKGATEAPCIVNEGRTLANGLHVAFQQDTLVLSGGDDDWTPSWSWHGFRYIEVTVPHQMQWGPQEIGAVVCYPMRTDVDVVANFTSSDPFLSKIRELNRNTFDSNMMSVQSDCPHRERFGYGGDPLGCGEAGLSIYDWSTFYPKRVRDFNDAQRRDVNSGLTTGAFTETAPFVGIADAGLGPVGAGPIGWETYQPVTQLWLYKYYGDIQTMADSFNQTYSFIKLLDSNPPGIHTGLGDWMPLQRTKPAYTGAGFQHMSYLAFANITELLGMPQLAIKYRAKASTIVDDLNHQFLNQSTGAYSASTSGKLNASQCGQGMALFFGMVPEQLRQRALEVMAANARDTEHKPVPAPGSDPNGEMYKCSDCKGGPGAHMTAGLFGIKWFLMSLADGGMNDLAYETLTTPSYPGFKWMMQNSIDNATTLWESWFFSANTYSHNHPMFASSEVWLLQSVAGIQPHPAAKGFDKVLIKPSPPSQLSHAEATYNTVRGRIETKWISEQGRITLTVKIPPNVVATVHIPTTSGHVQEAAKPGKLVTGRKIYNNFQVQSSLVTEVGSGTWKFSELESPPPTKAKHR